MTRPDENQQTVEAALNEICPAAYAVDCDLPEHEKARAAHGALRDLVAQAEAADRRAEQLAEQLRLAIEQDYCTICGRLLADDADAVPADSREQA